METGAWYNQCKKENRESYWNPNDKGRKKTQGTKYALESSLWYIEKIKIPTPVLAHQSGKQGQIALRAVCPFILSDA